MNVFDMNDVKAFPDPKVLFQCILDLSSWCNRKLTQGEETSRVSRETLRELKTLHQIQAEV